MDTGSGTIKYLYGIRGLSSLYIVLFHLNYIILAANVGQAEPLYHRLTDWMRYGDFRVSAFFVISGYLMTLPLAKRGEWRLPRGVRGFLERRTERLVVPYYVALAFSLVFFIAWSNLAGHPESKRALVYGIVTHLLMIHNFSSVMVLYINDTLWNIALEFQCYLIFALLLVPLMRRGGALGPWLQLAVAAAIGLVPHFFMHGLFDWTRPWFVLLFAMGVTACSLANRRYESLTAIEQRIPWGLLSIVFTIAAVVLIVLSGIDTPYGDGWAQNITLGCATASLLVYTQTGMRGAFARIIAPVVKALEAPKLCVVGRFSYSIYLLHYPILRLLVELLQRYVTHSALVQGMIALLVFYPLTIAFAYGFHLVVERPYLQGTRRLFPERDALLAVRTKHADGAETVAAC
jgi:peptidoglycan/LPS O-acetylase OafA/YrhL